MYAKALGQDLMGIMFPGLAISEGHTSRRAKCVPVYEELVCDEDAGNVEKRVNGHTAPDTFVIWFDKKRSLDLMLGGPPYLPVDGPSPAPVGMVRTDFVHQPY